MLHTQSLAVKHSGAQRRYVALMLVLLSGVAVLNLILTIQPEPTTPRWPTSDDVYRVAGWTMAAPQAQSAWGITHITRTYSGAHAEVVSLIISTSPDGKSLYKAGADLAFLGQGFTASDVSSQLVPPAPSRGAKFVRRDNETTLLLFAFGERRGLLGNGALAWTLYGFDALLGRPNDYFLLRIVAPLRDPDSSSELRAATELADTLFPRISAWYASR